MKIEYSKKFVKELKKSTKKIREKFGNQLNIFLENPYSPTLHNHKLHGIFNDYRSINIDLDWRAIYRNTEEGPVFFVAVGTHSQLYK